MNKPSLLLCCALLCHSSVMLAADPLGGMRLLPGYQHEPLQGIDSIVGRVQKQDGLLITYEIGAVTKPGAPRLGGGFTDRPKNTPKEQLRWYREQVVAGEPVHLAYRKDDQLMLSFPERGANFSVKVTDTEQLADALLMILTYPDKPAEK